MATIKWLPLLFALFLALCLPTVCGSYRKKGALNALVRRGGGSGASSNIPPLGFFNPLESNGSMLTQVPDTYPAGLGEPLNVIVSANSDAAVLVPQLKNGGLLNYFQAIGFSGQCLGQHAGSDQGADLGDGNGYKNETDVMRWNYGDPTLGTCKETIEGGNHFRYWVQNGKQGNSGAVFLALSYELPISQQHDIINDGYNLGRDWLVGNATSQTSIPTASLANASTYSGTAEAQGYTYHTDVVYLSGLLPNTSTGINHYITVGATQNAIDGLVAVLTVHITQRPQPSHAMPLQRRATLLSPIIPAFLLLFII